MRLGTKCTAAVAVLGLLLVGCSSNKQATSAPVVTSMKQLREEMSACKVAVDKTQAALNEVSTGADVKASYDKLNAAVEDLHDAAADLKQQADEMRAKGQAYIAKWKEEMDKVPDEDIRASAAKRREAVAKSFESIRDAAAGARDSYGRYDKMLNAIQTTLKNDMTPAATNMISGTLRKALAEGNTLKGELDKLTGHLDNVKAGISATRPTTTPAK